MRHFNSTMGRLKVRTKAESLATTSFQFHYGTIKRHIPVARLLLNLWFQFHYGTIKSLKNCNSSGVIRYFNSTMGRLKVSSGFCSEFLRWYFNSTMGRLKGLCWQFQFLLLPFQFHYGTIKSRTLPKGVRIFENFNSTMGRLKVRQHQKPQSFHNISIPLWDD